MTKKLLYIVNDADYFVSHRIELAKAAKNNGYEVSVATKDGSKNYDIQSAGFKTFDIPIQRGKSSLITELKTLFAIKRILQSNEFDCIHVITIKATLLSGLAGKLAHQKNMIFALTGLGYIFTEETLLIKTLRFLIFPILRFVMNGGKYCTIFQNPDDQKLFIDKNIISKNNSVVIKGSGVDINHFKPFPTPDGQITILFSPFRILKHKGAVELIKATKILKEKKLNARVVFIGDIDPDNPSSITKEQLLEWKDSGLIEWWGRFSDTRKVFKQTHIVCLPSYREGLPKSLLDVASCALPIVTTNIPGCREIVKDGYNGFLVPAQSIEPLADALEKLILDESLRKKMGANGRKLVENELSIDHVIKQTLSLYKECIS